MRRALIAWSVVLVALAGCSKGSQEAPPTTSVAAPASPSLAASPPPAPTPPAPAQPPPLPPAEPPAADEPAADEPAGEEPASTEVEIMGDVGEGVAAERYAVVVSENGCEPKQLIPLVVPYAVTRMEKPGRFFLEIFVPQGTRGFFCALAIDGAKIVATGAYAKNPIVMFGQGEVIFDGVKFPLKRLARPVPLPPELLAR